MIKNKWLNFSFVFFFFALAFFLVFYKIGQIPSAVNGDMILNVSQAWRLAQHWHGNDINLPNIPYYFRYFPVGLLYYEFFPQSLIYAVSFYFLPASQLTIKIITASVAFLTLIPFYYLVKKIYDQKTALISLFFFSTSYWFLVFARSSSTYNFILLTGLFLILILIFQKANFWKWLLAGIFFGITIANGYPLFVLIPALIFFYLFWSKRFKELIIGFVPFLLIACFALISFSFLFSKIEKLDNWWRPIWRIRNEYFGERFSAQKVEGTNIVYLNNFQNGLYQLFIRSNDNFDLAPWRIHDWPIINPVLAILFSIGFFIALIRAVSGGKPEKLLVLWVILTFVLFSIKIKPTERYFWIMLPAIAILASLPIKWLFGKIKINKILFGGVLSLLAICYLLIFTYRPYFVDYAKADGNDPTNFATQQFADWLKQNYHGVNNSPRIILSTMNPGLGLFTDYGYSSISWYEDLNSSDPNFLEYLKKKYPASDWNGMEAPTEVEKQQARDFVKNFASEEKLLFLFNLHWQLGADNSKSDSSSYRAHRLFKQFFPELKPVWAIEAGNSQPGYEAFLINKKEFQP